MNKPSKETGHVKDYLTSQVHEPELLQMLRAESEVRSEQSRVIYHPDWDASEMERNVQRSRHKPQGRRERGVVTCGEGADPHSSAHSKGLLEAMACEERMCC